MHFYFMGRNMMNDFVTIKEISEKWNLTPRRIQKMCAEGKISGAIKFGRDWAIPANAEKSKDSRVKSGEYRNWRKKQDE